jgi:hypothetical protein
VLLLQKNGKFKLAKQTNIEKATKAMYETIYCIHKKYLVKFVTH